MGTATLRWISGKQFIGIDSTRHSVILSTPDEGVGIKPSDLLLIAVASCTAVDVVEILSKKRMPLDHLEISCTGEQDQDPPWTFRKIHLRYIVGGKNLTEQAVAQAIHLSEEKYCSVAATVRATAQITTEFEVIEEPELELTGQVSENQKIYPSTSLREVERIGQPQSTIRSLTSSYTATPLLNVQT